MVTGGSSSDPYISPGSAGAGMMRWNPNMNCMEVNDGSMWKSLGMSYATVTLDAEAESLLNWAREEKNKQIQRESRIKSNPALRKAYEAILRAQDNFDILDKIAGEDNSGPQQQIYPGGGYVSPVTP